MYMTYVDVHTYTKYILYTYMSLYVHGTTHALVYHVRHSLHSYEVIIAPGQ
jgi:hypothetical protein